MADVPNTEPDGSATGAALVMDLEALLVRGRRQVSALAVTIARLERLQEAIDRHLRWTGRRP